MQPEIRYVDYGIANNFGEFIEVNKFLDEEPELKQAILNHELYHTKNKQDLIMDMAPKKINQLALLRFMFRHPKSFMQFLPFYWQKDKGFVYDINSCLFYIFTFAVIGIIAYFLV